MNPCDNSLFATSAVCMGKKAADAASTMKEVVSFGSDPAGYLAQKLQEGAAGLAGTIFPALNDVTHPDLSQAWFRDAYQVTWGLAMFLWVGILLWTLVLRARRRISGDELLDTFTTHTPLFFAGCTFGPLVGAFLLQGVGLLSDSLAKWGLGTVDETTTKLQAAIAAGDADQVAGGAVVAMLVFGCLIVALLLVLLMLLVMLVTLYLTGAVMPLGLAWITHPRHRSRGLRLLYVWFGVASSHVLIFLSLGIAFRLVAGQVSAGGEALQVLVNLIVAGIALMAATCSPAALVAFAPVGPTDGGSGGKVSLPSPSGGSRSGWSGTDSPTDSHTAQLSRSGSGVTPSPTSEGGDGGSPGPLSRHLQELQSGGGGGGGGGGTPKPSAAGLEAPSGAGTAAGGGAEAGAVAGAGEAATAAGAATTATGVGAAVGVALMGAGVALSATASATQQAGAMAADHMDHAEGGGQDAADPSPRW